MDWLDVALGIIVGQLGLAVIPFLVIAAFFLALVFAALVDAFVLEPIRRWRRR